VQITHTPEGTLKMKLTRAVVAFSLYAVGIAHADMTVAQFKQGSRAPSGSPVAMVHETYLSGLAEGMATSNVLMREAGGKGFYCAGGKHRLDNEEVQRSIEQGLKNAGGWTSTKHDQVPVSIVLFHELKGKYPCT